MKIPVTFLGQGILNSPFQVVVSPGKNQNGWKDDEKKKQVKLAIVAKALEGWRGIGQI